MTGTPARFPLPRRSRCHAACATAPVAVHCCSGCCCEALAAAMVEADPAGPAGRRADPRGQPGPMAVAGGPGDGASLQGRRIVVGMTASGIAPRLLTPTTREFWMSGSEYQANITSMLLQYKQIDVLPHAWQHAISGVLGALCGVLL